MSPITFTHYSARVLLITTLIWSTGGQATTVPIPDFPLFLTSAGVPPNLTLTLDDSGSMSWAYTPDLVSDNYYYYREYSSALDGRYVKSADYNPIYYNPKTTYTAPVDANGNTLSTSFTAAYLNGFNPSSAKIDLSKSYQPTAGLYPQVTTDTTANHWHMRHYSSDVACNTVSGVKRCQYNSAAGSGTNWLNTQSTTNCTAGVDCCTSDSDCQPTSSGSKRPMPAYYYVYDSSNSGCNKTLTDNNCYDIKIVSGTSGADRDGDGTISLAEQNEYQNFANWYSFYRTRNLMTVSAASLAMSTLLDTVRVAWQAINSCRGGTNTLVTTSCRGWNTSVTAVSNAIYPFSGTQKTDFYSWLLRLPASGGTPLLSAAQRVGNYYKLVDLAAAAGTPYDDDLTSSSNNKVAACRKNFQLIMTDGMWNNDTITSYDNYDSKDHTLPDKTAYSKKTPYQDDNDDSLADIAFFYWANDLSDPVDDEISPSIVDPAGAPSEIYFNAKNNPATWQHMVNYTVGLGMTPYLASAAGGLLSWGGDTYSGSYPEILKGALNGGKDWPTTNNAGVAGNAADLWHAAINSRGKFYNVQGPKEMNAAFQDIINTISSAAASGGGSALSFNAQRTTDKDATSFIAGFNSDWSGTLKAVKINEDGTLATITKPDGTKALDPTWDAGSLIPPGNQQPPKPTRHIFTLTDSSAQELTISICASSNSLTTALNKNASGVDNFCSQRLAWLRGHTAITSVSAWDSVNKKITFTAPNHGLKQGNSVVVSGVTLTGTTPPVLNITYEILSVTNDTFTVSLGTDPGGTYVADVDGNDQVRFEKLRNRTTSTLGDIMNSSTVYVGKDKDKDQLDYGGANIKVAGQDTYAAYVAAKASKTPVVYAGANDGMLHAFNAEISGPNMGMELFAYVPAGVYHNLSALTDPNYTASHKFFVDGTPTVRDAHTGGWKTYLVGGLRKGGKSIYALDVSNPDSFSDANVKWEFTDASDLGLTYSQPQIVAVSDTQWAAIFGNGYNSTNEDAVLYIVNLETGSPIKKIKTNSGPSNGLSTPYPFDKNKDGIVDVIYAGDLQGHLWKFEKDKLGDWDIGNSGKPLLTARNDKNQVQPITVQPKAVVLPSDSNLAPSPFNGQVMVYFGTGRYLAADPTKPTDKTVNDLISTDVQTFYGVLDNSSTTGTALRANLLEQTIENTVTTPGGTFRIPSNNTTPDSTIRGCYLDFNTTTPPTPSERITGSALVKVFKTLETRVIFATSTPTDESCGKGGTSWLMELSASCGRLTKSPLDVDNNGTFDKDDLINGQAVGGLALPLLVPSPDAPPWIEGKAPSKSGDPAKAYKMVTDTDGNVHKIEQPSEYITSGPPKRISWEQVQ